MFPSDIDDLVMRWIVIVPQDITGHICSYVNIVEPWLYCHAIVGVLFYDQFTIYDITE